MKAISSRFVTRGSESRQALLLNDVSAVGSTFFGGASNVVLQLLAAHWLSADEFARFAIGATTILFVAGFARSVIGQTDLIRGLRGSDTASASVAYLFAGVTAIVGIVTGAASLVIWRELFVTLATAFVVAAVFILQDCARFRAFRVQRAPWALLSDIMVFVLCAGAFFGMATGASAEKLLLVWGGATAAGWLVLVRPLDYLGQRSAALRWWVQNRDLVVPGGLEFLLQSFVPYLLYWAVLFLGGAAALAGYRVVQLLFGGLANLALGVSAFELPKISDHPSGKDIRSFLLRNSAVLVALAIVLFIAVDRLPEQTGVAIFGDSWAEASVFLLAGAAHGLVNALSIGNYQALRMLGEARYSLAVQAVSVLLIPLVCLVLGHTFGAVGIAWGLAIVATIGYAARLARTIECSGDERRAASG